MTNTLRAIRSTLNFLLAMLELIVSIVLAIKVFGSDVASEEGLGGYIVGIYEMLGGGVKFILDCSQIEGPISFLALVLTVMVFGFALMMRVPQILEGERDVARPSGYNYKYFRYRKKRFRRNRFLIK